MRRNTSATRNRRVSEHMLLAVLLGVTAGLFIGGYWLVDYFPADSRQLVLLTCVCAAGAAVLYYSGISRILAGLAGLVASERTAVGVLGAALGCFLLFAGTSEWQRNGRYLTFLLPRHDLRLKASGAPAGTALVWMNTSLGDVSYSALVARGWARRDEAMILQDPAQNSLEWSGRVGDHVQLVFESARPGGQLDLSWDGNHDVILMDRRRTTHEVTFSVPFHASQTFVLLLGALNFTCLSAGLILVGRRITAPWQLPGLQSQGQKKSNTFVRGQLLVLLLIMCLAGLLRGFNLGRLYPAVDEYYHLIAAKQLLAGAPLESVYERGLWIVTLPIALALRVFGHEIWAARAVGVLFNVLAIVPLYLVARKISHPVSMLACLLYATSPWIITFGRVAREYAYYPFYFYWIVYAMVSLVEAIPAGFVIRGQWRQLARPRFVLIAALLALPPIFALSIDWLSTFRTILIAYLVLGAFVLSRFDWMNRANWPFLAVACLIVGLGGWYARTEQVTKLLPAPRINPVPLQYFFPNPQQQWYFERVGLLVALAVVLATVAAVSQRRYNFVPLFFIVLWGSYMAVFALISKSFFHTRHLISTQFWFVIVVAAGMWWLWDALRQVVPWRGVGVGVTICLVLSFMVLNPGVILLPSLSSNPDMRISEDYLHDFSDVQAYMLDHVQEDDALIATVYGLFATWEGKPQFGEMYRITSATTQEEINSIVEQHESGWIVIDSIRMELSALTIRELTHISQMEYIGIFGDEHVWRWGLPNTVSPTARLSIEKWTYR